MRTPGPMSLEEVAGADADRIVTFSLNESLTSLNVCECCDYYFEAFLTKAEVGNLIARLCEFHAHMKEDLV